MATEKAKVITAKDVVRNLRNRFSSPEFAFLEQVADGTGARRYRWADAVAMSVWPSRGYDIHGIEVKVSRYDWQKELSQPEKSAAVQQYCNHWWIATSSESVIQAGELPSTWGWMVMKGDGMRVIKEAPPLEPSPISVDFLASILRNVQKADEADVERRINSAHQNAYREGGKHYEEKYAKLKSACDEFEGKSGIRLAEWNAGDMGEAVSTLINLKYRLQRIEESIKAAADIQNMLEKVRELADLHNLCRECSPLQDH